MEIVQTVAALTRWIRSRIELGSDQGATAVEYAIMVALIAAVVFALVAALGSQLVPGFCAVVVGLGGAC
jgi:pilus assembly protein Flp/PilA